MFKFQYFLLKFQGIAFFIMLIILAACTGPYAVPKKEKNEESTRVIFEDMEKEKNIQDNEMIEEIVEDQKEKVESLAQFGPIRRITNKDLSLNRKKIINTSEPSTPLLASLNTDLYESFPITMAFTNSDIREVMQVFSEITDRNILVGKEVEATLNIELRDIPWKIALKSILDIEGLTWAIDNKTGIIRIHSKDVLKAQISYDEERLQSLNAQLDYQANLVPKSTAVFQLYYISAEIMLERLNEAIGGGSGEGEVAGNTISSLQLMAEPSQNTIIANGTEEDLTFVEKIINEVDLPVEQVLIEAIIVKASDTFQEALGTRLGGAVDMTSWKGYGEERLRDLRGTQQGPGKASSGEDSTQAFATASDSDTYNQDRIADFAISAPTMGLGIIADIGFAQLKGEIYTMQSEGLTKTIHNPKVFVLDNQQAEILSGTQIAYSGGEDGQVSMVDATLNLTVTPHIVGDGNIKITLAVTNDSPAGEGANPPISKLQISTNLIVEDGDVVVIGGVFANTESQSESKVPILGDIPIIGRLFRSDAKTDNQDQVLIFIAPKVV